jgi:glyoxylase-like metal-dependent hydrolase (beta-lactamase superfamily II)
MSIKSITTCLCRHFEIALIIFLSCSIANKSLAQEANEIDKKRTTIASVKDSLIKISSHIYVIRSFGEAGNIAIYENPDGFILVDDQWVELMPKIKKLLATLSDKPVKFVLNTHFHYDHTDGNKALGKEGSIIISHDNIRKRLAEKQVLSLSNLVQKAYPFESLPFITFSDSLTLNEPNEKIKVYHVKHAHTDGDSFIEFVYANTIHTGDVFVRYGFPYIDANNGGNIYGMIDAIDMLINRTNDSTKIIPGHGPISYKKDLITYRDNLLTIVNRIKDGIESNLTIEEIRKQNPLEGVDFSWFGYFHLEMIYSMVQKKLKNME